jgi:FHS family L-fucose permease-like MFS transporter
MNERARSHEPQLSSAAQVHDTARSQRLAFASIATLFFAWGFITVCIDPLIASLKAIFELSYTEVMLTQFAFFLAYGVVSLPAAALIARLGYARSLLAALVLMTAGCLSVLIATSLASFRLVLLAIFVIASGITILQVAANPLAALLGPPARAHFRLTLSQAFNSLGTAMAPYLAASIMLSGGIFAAGGSGPSAGGARLESLRHIDLAFVLIAVMVAALAVFVWLARRRFQSAPVVASSDQHGRVGAALRSPWALLGSTAIFLYVGAEVSIGSTLTNFLHQADVLGISVEGAGKLVSLYWGGAMLGRFVGSALLTRVRASVLLVSAAAAAALLCLTVNQATGEVAGWAAVAVGLCNSIMFPVIFTLTLERSSAAAAATSGLLCVSIVGGAVLPLWVGRIADLQGLRTAYLVPLVAYVCIGLFGAAAARKRVTEPTADATRFAH